MRKTILLILFILSVVGIYAQPEPYYAGLNLIERAAGPTIQSDFSALYSESTGGLRIETDETSPVLSLWESTQAWQFQLGDGTYKADGSLLGYDEGWTLGPWIKGDTRALMQSASDYRYLHEGIAPFLTGEDPLFFVDADNGSDVSGDGSIAYPFQTLSAAESAIGAGADATVYLTPGTYSLTTGDQFFGKDVSLRGAGPETVVQSTASYRRLHVEDGRGFTFRHGAGVGDATLVANETTTIIEGVRFLADEEGASVYAGSGVFGQRAIFRDCVGISGGVEQEIQMRAAEAIGTRMEGSVVRIYVTRWAYDNKLHGTELAQIYGYSDSNTGPALTVMNNSVKVDDNTGADGATCIRVSDVETGDGVERIIVNGNEVLTKKRFGEIADESQVFAIWIEQNEVPAHVTHNVVRSRCIPFQLSHPITDSNLNTDLQPVYLAWNRFEQVLTDTFANDKIGPCHIYGAGTHYLENNVFVMDGTGAVAGNKSQCLNVDGQSTGTVTVESVGDIYIFRGNASTTNTQHVIYSEDAGVDITLVNPTFVASNVDTPDIEQGSATLTIDGALQSDQPITSSGSITWDGDLYTDDIHLADTITIGGTGIDGVATSIVADDNTDVATEGAVHDLGIVGLTSNTVPKGLAGTALQDSNIIDNGSTIAVTGDFTVTGDVEGATLTGTGLSNTYIPKSNSGELADSSVIDNGSAVYTTLSSLRVHGNNSTLEVRDNGATSQRVTFNNTSGETTINYYGGSVMFKNEASTEVLRITDSNTVEIVSSEQVWMGASSKTGGWNEWTAARNYLSSTSDGDEVLFEIPLPPGSKIENIGVSFEGQGASDGVIITLVEMDSDSTPPAWAAVSGTAAQTYTASVPGTAETQTYNLGGSVRTLEATKIYAILVASEVATTGTELFAVMYDYTEIDY